MQNWHKCCTVGGRGDDWWIGQKPFGCITQSCRSLIIMWGTWYCILTAGGVSQKILPLSPHYFPRQWPIVPLARFEKKKPICLQYAFAVVFAWFTINRGRFQRLLKSRLFGSMWSINRKTKVFYVYLAFKIDLTVGEIQSSKEVWRVVTAIAHICFCEMHLQEKKEGAIYTHTLGTALHCTALQHLLS